eukprot:15343989-Ditylum_brightwellii.AAC.1
MGTDDDFNPPDNWEELFKFSCLNLLTDWDLVTDGYLPELAVELLSETEVYAWQCKQHWKGKGFNPLLHPDPEPHSIDDADNVLLQVMSIPEGDDNSSDTREPVIDHEEESQGKVQRYPIWSTQGKRPRGLDYFE